MPYVSRTSGFLIFAIEGPKKVHMRQYNILSKFCYVKMTKPNK